MGRLAGNAAILSTASLPGRIARGLSFRSRRAIATAAAAMNGNGVAAYWYSDILNFGDLITPLLLRHFGYVPIPSRPMSAQLIATGSVLEHVSNDFGGLILGSGFIDSQSRMTFPKARVLAVRGRLTRERMNRCEEVLLGDPGLLAPRVLSARQPKQFELGIVPHHSERSCPTFARLAANQSASTTVIDVEQRPMSVFREIDRCEHIASSSLHGLIVAEALGIPTVWLDADRLVGGRFKFDDYYSSLDLSCDPWRPGASESADSFIARTTRKPLATIERLSNGLERLWRSLPEILATPRRP